MYSSHLNLLGQAYGIAVLHGSNHVYREPCLVVTLQANSKQPMRSQSFLLCFNGALYFTLSICLKLTGTKFHYFESYKEFCRKLLIWRGNFRSLAQLDHRSLLGKLFVHGLSTVSMGHI